MLLYYHPFCTQKTLISKVDISEVPSSESAEASCIHYLVLVVMARTKYFSSLISEACDSGNPPAMTLGSIVYKWSFLWTISFHFITVFLEGPQQYGQACIEKHIYHFTHLKWRLSKSICTFLLCLFTLAFILWSFLLSLYF